MQNSNYRFTLFFPILLGLLFLIACKKDEQAEKKPETGTLTDIEGNVYKTVKIGNQWWMAENLKVRRFRNGNPIIIASTNDLWKEQKPAFCNYNNNDASGILYNFYAASDPANIAPEGWHVPTDKEWKELEQALGMSASEADGINWRGSNEGEKLKKQGFQYWRNYPNVWATDESGFSAISDGCRLFSGEYSFPNGPGFLGFWWTSTAGDQEAWYRHLDYKRTDVFRFYGSKNYGFSIRCVKD